MNQETDVWILPNSKTILIDNIHSIPAEACNWTDIEKQTAKTLLNTEDPSALFQFKSFHEASNFVNNLMEQRGTQQGWGIDYLNEFSILTDYEE